MGCGAEDVFSRTDGIQNYPRSGEDRLYQRLRYGCWSVDELTGKGLTGGP